MVVFKRSIQNVTENFPEEIFLLESQSYKALVILLPW